MQYEYMMEHYDQVISNYILIEYYKQKQQTKQ